MDYEWETFLSYIMQLHLIQIIPKGAPKGKAHKVPERPLGAPPPNQQFKY